MQNSKTMLKAPFPYFGGKSRIAGVVWKYLGDVDHYVEPFFGSGAVLLNRPNYDPAKHVETINDKDGFVANVWRSLKFSPDETAYWADWPVNHADLSARKKKLVDSENYLLENLVKDDEWHDTKLAGYWIWAASCWIGAGLTRHGQIPHLAGSGKGVHGKISHLTGVGMGIHGQIPRLGNTGRGIHSLGKLETSVENDEYIPKNIKIYKWFGLLAERLRRVRVVCGEWYRVCGGNWQDDFGICGVFFDPPYSHGIGKRSKDLYHHDSFSISSDVRKWCLERGDKPTYRIVLAGYEGEHNELEKNGWKKISWKANGGYANNTRKKDSKACGKDNAKLERLWISPHCVTHETETNLF